jgi:hypothetical protein
VFGFESGDSNVIRIRLPVLTCCMAMDILLLVLDDYRITCASVHPGSNFFCKISSEVSAKTLEQVSAKTLEQVSAKTLEQVSKEFLQSHILTNRITIFIIILIRIRIRVFKKGLTINFR